MFKCDSKYQRRILVAPLFQRCPCLQWRKTCFLSKGDAIQGAYHGIDQNGFGFSTFDRDNDGCDPCIFFCDIAARSCTDFDQGGWRYSKCGSASLNGEWHPKGANTGWLSGLHWLTWKRPVSYSARATRMMFTPMWHFSLTIEIKQWKYHTDFLVVVYSFGNIHQILCFYWMTPACIDTPLHHLQQLQNKPPWPHLPGKLEAADLQLWGDLELS